MRAAIQHITQNAASVYQWIAQAIYPVPVSLLLAGSVILLLLLAQIALLISSSIAVERQVNALKE